eukprot:jgi/Chlat1/6245/Chrsp44S05857
MEALAARVAPSVGCCSSSASSSISRPAPRSAGVLRAPRGEGVAELLRSRRGASSSSSSSSSVGLPGTVRAEAPKSNFSSTPKSSGSRSRASNVVNAVAAQAPKKNVVKVALDNESDAKFTVISIETDNKPRLLHTINSTFHTLGIDVVRAVVSTDDGIAKDVFYVTDSQGRKLDDKDDINNVREYLEAVLGADRPTAVAMKKRPTSKIFDEVREQGDTAQRKTDLLYHLMGTYIKNDVLSIQESIVNHVEYTIARSRYKFDDFEAYQATAHSVRDRLIESWNDTQQYFRDQDPKRVYYLSMEFLMGRSLLNCLYNLSVKEQYDEALAQLGYNLESIAEQERDAALGNGGLGRLAACFLDSLATLNYPAWGYGIRYQYGMFRQTLKDGFQHEQPDYWLTFGNPWEIERPNISYPVKFYGHVSSASENGKLKFTWNPAETVMAVAYDNPIPGFDTENTINLRLWGAKPSGEFDLESFNTGDYIAAILNKQRAETISSVLYPDDRTFQGKELRLRQQYFFVSATLQDIIRRFKDVHDVTKGKEVWDLFGEKVALQLNDTHPTIGVPELMRLLMDEEGLGWTQSWKLTTKVFSFTNHTVLPEALEKWPLPLFERLLPRHIQIVYDINQRFLDAIKAKFGDDFARMSSMSIIEEGEPKQVRMAHLALVASRAVNGVAAIHTDILKAAVFKDFYELWPEKFQNKTNGVTQRRWLAFCNPGLREIISKWLGTEKWITELDLLAGLREHADNPELQAEWRAIKNENKIKLAAVIKRLTGQTVNANALFDVQVKRIHEYKRQLLNVLSVIYRYTQIKSMSPEERKKVVPRVVVIGGKAAPGYDMAKRIIKLVCSVGEKINNDPDVGDLLKLFFLPDYNVSLAETIIPATELSQHISTAGTEASGTSNMKFAMNGSLIIGTMDGANVEIAQEVGEENMFIFGLLAHDVPKARAERMNYRPDGRFLQVVDMIRTGFFGWQEYLSPIAEAVEGYGGDYYLVANDFASYLEAQAEVDRAYVDQARWTRMSIMNTAGSGKFSSDRTIKQYAEEIWGVEPCKRS